MLPLNANSLSERKGDLRSRKIARFGLVIPLFIALNIGLLKDDSVALTDRTNHYRQWAFIQLNNLDQFYCLDELITKNQDGILKPKMVVIMVFLKADLNGLVQLMDINR
jgi:hypothetical protein